MVKHVRGLPAKTSRALTTIGFTGLLGNKGKIITLVVQVTGQGVPRPAPNTHLILTILLSVFFFSPIMLLLLSCNTFNEEIIKNYFGRVR